MEEKIKELLMNKKKTEAMRLIEKNRSNAFKRGFDLFLYTFITTHRLDTKLTHLPP